LSFDDIKTMANIGADLSYDFINRPSYHHAFAVADTEFLRLTLRSAHEFGIDPASLVHALQNHDDLTYELVHFWTLHKDDTYNFRDVDIKGSELRELIRKELQQHATGKQAGYNLLFTTNGIACTTASFITAVLGYSDVAHLKPTQIENIKQAHLLLAMFNAWQPGVFALSGWDLCGSLTLSSRAVSDLIKDGDTRWINRGAYDLMNVNPDAEASAAGMPRAKNLYGSLPEQLADPRSFVSQLQALLKLRKDYGLATAHQIDIPEVSQKGMLVMVHRLPKDDRLQVTVLNFSNEEIAGTVSSEHLPAGADVMDMLTSREVATVDDLHSFHVKLAPYQGLSLLITETLSVEI
jgi:trehalose synthase